jgi:hypothetical protein
LAQVFAKAQDLRQTNCRLNPLEYLNPIVLKFTGVIKTPKDSTFQFELLNIETNVEIFEKYPIF